MTCLFFDGNGVFFVPFCGKTVFFVPFCGKTVFFVYLCSVFDILNEKSTNE
jgi:hypothetical protein